MMHPELLLPGCEVSCHQLVEGRVRLSSPSTANQALDVLVTATIEQTDGTSIVIPAFWAGDDRWCFRFVPEKPGTYTYRFDAASNANFIGEQTGFFRVLDDSVPSPLMQSGGLRLHKDGRFLETGTGKPFFWLADSWWFAMCKRIRYPDEFRALLRDRKEKGFSVIQFAIAFACDIAPFDSRDHNESEGCAWTEGYGQIRPEYFDAVDRRIFAMIDEGLVPNIVGAWAYYLRSMGVDKMTAHWRYLVARYGSLPVVWTLCGEVRLGGYRVDDAACSIRESITGQPYMDLINAQVSGWTKVARALREFDPWKRPLTAHAGPKPDGKDIPELVDLDLFDFHFLQPGHSDLDAVACTQRDLSNARKRVGAKMILVGECCFEGMQGGAGPKVQRNLFWSSVLSGMPGYSYGVDALWQMNRPEEPFGPSVLGHIWGNHPWQEAMHWEGSRGVGIGARYLNRLPWHRLEPHPEWVSTNNTQEVTARTHYAAGIPGELVLIYFPSLYAPWSRTVHLYELKPGALYAMEYLDPATGDVYPQIRMTASDEGILELPRPPILQDWVLKIELVQ